MVMESKSFSSQLRLYQLAFKEGYHDWSAQVEIWDQCILVGYSTQSKGYCVYSKRTRMIVESIHIRFDEIKEVSEMSIANNTSGLVPQRQKASDYDNPDPVPQRQDVFSSADAHVPSQQELDLLFVPLYDEFFSMQVLIHKTNNLQRIFNLHHHHPLLQMSMLRKTTIIKQKKENNYKMMNLPILYVLRHKKLLSLPHTTLLVTDPKMCMYALTVSTTEPKNIKEAMADSAWIEAMQEELHQFDRLQAWELVDKPFGKTVIKLKWLWKNKKGEDQTVIRNKA
uniref:Retrovirus-related Pol polyprotein from transposon TNT 1-94 n=1 Tax=Tanacetum cinerariifolium TaxID=118510 RepID=A0A699H347_TANCI|nr:retrovirus-related Pol polyprotein from transposon TNT 1-94 [Tanacetum cinerariifolium]